MDKDTWETAGLEGKRGKEKDTHSNASSDSEQRSLCHSQFIK